MKLESWQRLNFALEHYKSLGFIYHDASWDVMPEISAITCPNTGTETKIGDKVLVGSAEQSFLQDYKKLGNHIYFAITPCFRTETKVDDLTQNYFMKVELFSKNLDSLHYIILSAYRFITKNIDAVMIPTEEGFDIISRIRGIELGSYGTRHRNGMSWVYGTGLAEPRLTNAKPHEDALVL